jgi:hypothetical protein
VIYFLLACPPTPCQRSSSALCVLHFLPI